MSNHWDLGVNCYRGITLLILTNTCAVLDGERSSQLHKLQVGATDHSHSSTALSEKPQKKHMPSLGLGSPAIPFVPKNQEFHIVQPMGV